MKSLEMKNGSLARQRSGNLNIAVAGGGVGAEDTTLPLSSADRLPSSPSQQSHRLWQQQQQHQQQQRGRQQQTNNNGYISSALLKFFHRMDSSSVYSTVSMFDDNNDYNNDNDVNDSSDDILDEEGQVIRGIKRTSSKNVKQAAEAAAQRRRFYIRFMGLFVLGILLAFGLGFTSGKGRRNNDNTINGTVVSSFAGSKNSADLDSASSPLAQQQQQHKCSDDPIMALRSSSSAEGYAHGAVASDHAVCSQVGTSIMRDHGGNAIDAAVAVALCLGVANPASSGIGGGAFMLIHADPVDEAKMNASKMPDFIDAREQVNDDSNRDDEIKDHNGKISEVIDCREVAPSQATTHMFAEDVNGDEYASTFGGLAVAVPAELRGLELAHKRHGRLPWSAVVQPAMDLARHGVIVNANLAHEISVMVKYFEGCDVDYGLQSLLTRDNDWNMPLQQGDVFTNPKLADTLRAIMDQGSDFLYTGPGAAALAATVQNAGGILSQDDIEQYRPIIRTPLVAHDVGGFGIVGVGPPSSGGAAIIGIARFLAGFTTPYASFADTLSVHRLAEACRHAFAIRMSLSDPAYNTETVQDAVHDMVRGDYMERLRQSSQDDSTLPLSQYGGEKWALLNDTHGTAEGKDNQEGDRRRLARPFGYLEDHGTSHFSVVDGEGNAVAMTTSVNTLFGSKIVCTTTGVLLNNQMDDFATPGRPNGFGLAPSESNFIQPGKQPLSSMSPTMVFRRNDATIGERSLTSSPGRLGELLLVLGASGGPKIITAVVQTVLNRVVMGMPLFEAVIQPRIHDQLVYNDAHVTAVERSTVGTGDKAKIRLNPRTVDALRQRNHTILPISYTGAVQAIAYDVETKTLSATSDVRKGGGPDGY